LAACASVRPLRLGHAFTRYAAAFLCPDASAKLANIVSPTLITCGRLDMVTSTRFAEPLQHGIGASEVAVFEGCAHAPIYEKVDEFNERTLAFLGKHPL